MTCVAPLFLNSVPNENGGMDWRDISTVDALSFGTLYSDTGSKRRRRQVEVLLQRMCNSRASAIAPLPRPAPEESTEGQISETGMVNDEAEEGKVHLESPPRMDERYFPGRSNPSLPFWAKIVWLLDRLAILQGPHGAGKEAIHIEVRRDHLLEDSFNQVVAFLLVYLKGSVFDKASDIHATTVILYQRSCHSESVN